MSIAETSRSQHGRLASAVWLTGVVLATWAVLALPIWLGQGRWGLFGLTAAAVLCWVPGVGVLLALQCLPQPTELSAIAALVSGGVRMLFVAIGLVVGQRWFPELDFWRFSVWLAVFYTVTLATETTLLVRRRPLC
ncbi:MAG: hypothetical protein D6725_16030 [Planctomycetota bacterium]|nr:MAG: hypothetical protein D6725_16030 [Planctomycetota bacterium]